MDCVSKPTNYEPPRFRTYPQGGTPDGLTGGLAGGGGGGFLRYPNTYGSEQSTIADHLEVWITGGLKIFSSTPQSGPSSWCLERL